MRSFRESIISYDVIGLLISIPPSSAIDVAQQSLHRDATHSN